MPAKRATPSPYFYHDVTVTAHYRLYGLPGHMAAKGVQAIQKAVRSGSLEATVTVTKVKSGK